MPKWDAVTADAPSRTTRRDGSCPGPSVSWSSTSAILLLSPFTPALVSVYVLLQQCLSDIEVTALISPAMDKCCKSTKRRWRTLRLFRAMLQVKRERCVLTSVTVSSSSNWGSRSSRYTGSTLSHPPTCQSRLGWMGDGWGCYHTPRSRQRRRMEDSALLWMPTAPTNLPH